jgi:hypothetical protein
MRPMEKTPTTTARAVPVTIARITTMEKILIVLKYKKSSNRCYRLH